jgi:hypothetical protein
MSLTRRDLLHRTLHLTVLGAGASALAACTKDKPAAFKCDDTTGLAPAEIEARKALGYVDASPEPAKLCTNCQHYVAAATCGGCKVLKGTVHPNGYCKSWAAKA